MIWHALVDEQVTQPLEHIFARELLGDVNRQAFPYAFAGTQCAPQSRFSKPLLRFALAECA